MQKQLLNNDLRLLDNKSIEWKSYMKNQESKHHSTLRHPYHVLSYTIL